MVNVQQHDFVTDRVLVNVQQHDFVTDCAVVGWRGNDPGRVGSLVG